MDKRIIAVVRDVTFIKGEKREVKRCLIWVPRPPYRDVKPRKTHRLIF